MKKFFTLLLCVMGMAFTANADELTEVRQCIDALLVQDHSTRYTMAPVMDPNQDGILSIADVTFLIDKALREKVVKKAPAKEIDIEGLIHEVLVSDGDPNINDVTDAITEKLNQQRNNKK